MTFYKTNLLERLAPAGQEHILRFWDELSPAEQEELGSQIESINWPQTMKWVDYVRQSGSAQIPFERLIPAPYVSITAPSDNDKALLAEARKHGIELLKSGRVGGFTVAGGQGTRLGYDGPKGTYCFSAIHNKSLFQFFAESILCNQDKYGVTLPWYIMTSPANNQATVDFFKENNYFGLNPANVMFFKQGTLPAFDMDGKALLQTKSSLALTANGHGGSFAALRDSGALDDMKKHGVDILSYWQVDNPMGNFFDPLFIGMHDLKKSEMSSRALIKRDAMEKLGHFCLLDGETTIVEYSDMPMELLQKTDADSRLTFRAGSPAIHVLSREFIERLTDGCLNLTPHRANKKVPCVDSEGNLVKPEKPNGIKLEFFLFDALPQAKNPLILEGDRAEVFSPIKNAEGSDSPDTCRQAMRDRTVRWLASIGVSVPDSATIELSPRLAVEKDDLLAIKDRIPSTIPENTVIAID